LVEGPGKLGSKESLGDYIDLMYKRGQTFVI
jgi:hypothetical protein